MNYTQKNAVSVPSAYVTKNKKRIKQFNDTVYLNNGDEFEIELFNPTLKKVLAKIHFNGIDIGSSGIVLRPGERVFLERYLNESKKFLFETYKVNGNNNDVKNAIQNNGNINVKFYSEYVPILSSYLTTINTGTYDNQRFFTTGTNIGTYLSGSNLTYTSSSNCFYNSNESHNTINTKSLSKEIETGRIEKGSNSNQNFTYDNTTFNTYFSWISQWKILPLSQKEILKEDLKVFCTECGSKRKKDSFRYCPNCGNKF